MPLAGQARTEVRIAGAGEFGVFEPVSSECVDRLFEVRLRLAILPQFVEAGPHSIQGQEGEDVIFASDSSGDREILPRRPDRLARPAQLAEDLGQRGEALVEFGLVLAPITA